MIMCPSKTCYINRRTLTCRPSPLLSSLSPSPPSELPVTITAQKAIAAAFKYRSDNPHILPAVNRGEWLLDSVIQSVIDRLTV